MVELTSSSTIVERSWSLSAIIGQAGGNRLDCRQGVGIQQLVAEV